MSHVSEAVTSIKDLTLLKKTLKEMGYGYYENSKIQGTYLGSGIKVDLVIDDKGDKNIGLVKNSDGVYSFKGDFWQKSKDKFINAIVQNYTVNVMKAELRKIGVSAISQTVEKDGEILLVGNLA